jgi:glucose/arabinose dehydrogenase
MAFLLSAVAAAVLLPTALAQSCSTISPAHAPTMASGYSSSVVMNGLKSPRGIVWDSAGNLLIVEAGGAGVRWVKLTDNGGTSVCVSSSKQLISDSAVRKFEIVAKSTMVFSSSRVPVILWADRQVFSRSREAPERGLA